MPKKYIYKLPDNLLDILPLIDQEEYEQGEDLFDEYLNNIAGYYLSSSVFSKNQEWLQDLQTFAIFLVMKKIDDSYISKIQKKKTQVGEKQQEIYHVMEIEIKQTGFYDRILLKEELNGLCKGYSKNPYFFYSNALLTQNKKKALGLIFKAVTIAPKMKTYQDTFNEYFSIYFEKYIDKKKYQKGLEEIEKYADEIENIKENAYINLVIDNYKKRLKDHLKISKEISKIPAKVQKELNQELNKQKEDLIIFIKDSMRKEQRRIIEILGIFTAIIAFIFSSVAIGGKFEYEQAMGFMRYLGVGLIAFAITMHLLFAPKYKNNDFRLWILIVLIVTMVFILFYKL